MYYRRKVLLALLEVLDREVAKTALQKYLFLISVEQERSAYDFVPYRYGCYSFQADADKKTLTKYGFLKDREHWLLDRKERFYIYSNVKTKRQFIGWSIGWETYPTQN